jgi:hypothetical protein
VVKFHSQLFEFDFRFSPFSDLLCHIFPLRNHQVVLEIAKKNQYKILYALLFFTMFLTISPNINNYFSSLPIQRERILMPG